MKENYCRMAEKEPFKVVIVGGSIAGLSLANMLQLVGIEYVILEAYPHIAPQVGASIGLLPHGNRILDQLGLFTKILSMAPPVKQFNFRNNLGTALAGFEGMTQSFVGRHGYPILFLDRQTVLQVLYDNLKDKSKVLTQKRVVRIERDADGTTAITTDESSYRGDIVVGADGIHSTIRSEMWRIANELSPGYMSSKEPTEVTCDYGCIFGISKPCKGIEPGCLHSIFRENSSYLVNGGPQYRVYWFYFFKLPETAHGSEVPRYTKEDEEKLLQERADDKILPNLKFRALFENRISSQMTALPEHVYDKWHYDRMITIGDSAHKFNPIAGHGGNAAIESAATLVNALCKALKTSSTGSLTTEQVNATFARVQEIREEKAKVCMKASHDQQQQEALENVAKKFVAFYLLPVSDKEDILYNFSSNIPNSEKLDMVELKRNPKLVPFKDELATPPKRRGIHGWYLMAFYLTCSALCHYGMWIRSAHYGLGNQFESILTTGVFPQDPTFPLKRTYIGISSIDNYLTFLSAAYMTGLKGWSKPFATLQLYFLGMLVAPIAIWAVESCRKRNAMTLVSTITIWLTLVQWAGVGIYMPLYYVCYTYISDTEPYWWPLSRAVPLHYAKALLPAIVVGYVTPTVLMFIPWSDPNTVQNFEALWQVCPMLVPIFTIVASMIYARLEPSEGTPMPKDSYEEYTDVPYLKRIYLVAFACGLLLHLGVISQILLGTDPSLTMASVFGPDFRAEPKTLGEGLRALFMADFWAFWIASYVWCASAVWDLKRVGRTNADVGKASALIALANIVVGPGAAMAGTWYWRERAMARTDLTKKGDA